MITDMYQCRAASADTPARRLADVDPHDDNDLIIYAKALYLGQGGDLRIIPAGGAEPVTLKNHAHGYVAVQVRRVLATGTTATQIVALFD